MKKFISIMLSILICLSISACGSKEYSLKVEIDSMPKNIDPQLASSISELMIVRNTFEGLMRYDKNGKLSLGTAESYSISNDKKTYTFKLKKGLLWSDDSPLTAHDYVFAVQRGASPVTKAPFSDILRNIKGVSSVLNNGSSNIGATAPDNYTVKFELNKPDSQFIDKLTHSIFMPCNKSFFDECKGKYGLTKNSIIFNGTYYVSTWNNDTKSVRISGNANYNGDYQSGPSFILLNQTKEENQTNKIRRLSNESINITQLSYSDLQYSNIESISVNNIYNSTYSIIFNHNTDVGSNNKLIKALSASVNYENIEKSVPSYFKITNTVVPSICKIGNTSSADVFSKTKKTYTQKQARSMFLDSLQNFENSAFPSFTLLCEDDKTIKSILTEVISYWQQSLGAYIRIESLPKEDMLNRIQIGNYTAAFVPLSATSEDVYDFLSSFKTGYSQNVINFSNKNFDNLVIENNKESVNKLKSAENLLINYSNIIPLFEAPTIYGCSNNLKGTVFSLFNGVIDFSYIYKE